MNCRFVTAVIASAALLISIGAPAANVDILEQNVKVDMGDPLTLTIIGSNFDNDVDSGGFRATWDPSVLSWVGISYPNPAWDTTFSFEDSTDVGSLDSVFLGSTSNAGINFTVAELMFTAIGDPDTNTIVQLSIDTFDTTWNINAVPYTTVVYGATTVMVNPIPIPAAVWLFGSALGLLGWMRRRRAA